MIGLRSGRSIGNLRCATLLYAFGLCLVRERRLTRAKYPHSTSRELKPSPPGCRQMCGASHIRPAATGTRLSLPVPSDAHRTRSHGECVQGCVRSRMWDNGAGIAAQARNRTCGFESQPMLIRSDRTVGVKPALCPNGRSCLSSWNRETRPSFAARTSFFSSSQINNRGCRH